MLSDREATELLSRSMRGRATRDEEVRLANHLEGSPSTRAFAEWSRKIEATVAQASLRLEAGDASVAPGLSSDAKRRLIDSIQAAIAGGATETRGDSAPSHATDAARRVLATAAVESNAGVLAPGEGRRMASRFTLLRKLGEGGLGTVWLARDERLHRNVALKEMSLEASTSVSSWKRFQREAEITGHLEHPNVVPIYQYGVDSDSGLPFYVMRFLGKRTLATAIVEYHQRRMAGERNPVEFHRLLTAFLGVCQAVAYAHSRKIVHRDLKPENVALDHFGQVIVLDWGLAKHVDDAESLGEAQSERLVSGEGRTLVGDVVGTPLYMAPEQAAGRLDEIDERTDVYGLGAILFAILTGCAPHENSAVGIDGRPQVEQVLRAIAEHDPPAPRDLDPAVPRELEAICRRSLARTRALRYESAEELAERVQGWMAGQHEKLRRYENLRMEGRDLRAGLDAAVRALGSNSRFMAGLPPIQGLVSVIVGRSADDRNVWRERLASIFTGLLQANSDFSSVSFVEIGAERSQELVRVERRGGGDGVSRSVPLSRLSSCDTCEFLHRVMRLKPDDVVTSLMTSSPVIEPTGPQSVLVAAVPVFDAVTEEPFGSVIIAADFARLVDGICRERIRTTGSVTVADAQSRILFYSGSDDPRHARTTTTVDDVAKACPRIVETLARQEEMVDEDQREWYATRLTLEAGNDYLALILNAED